MRRDMHACPMGTLVAARCNPVFMQSELATLNEFRGSQHFMLLGPELPGCSRTVGHETHSLFAVIPFSGLTLPLVRLEAALSSLGGNGGRSVFG